MSDEEDEGAGAADFWAMTPPPEPDDPVEQDALTDELIDRDLLDPVTGAGLAPMGVATPVPEEYFERFAQIFPRSILRVWRRFGFEGFGDGLFWITDPLEWAPVVQMWLEPVRDRLPFTDTWYCLARDAMGNLFLWGEKTGRSLEVDPTRVEVIIDQLALLSFDDPAVRERAGRVRFIGPAGRIVEDPEDDEDDMEPLLAPQALERLGPVDSGQVYGFVLPPALGGRLSVDNLRIVDAQTYLTLQAQQDEITVSDPVGANWGQVSTLIGADPMAPPVEQMGEENGGAAGAGQGDAGSAIPWHMVPEPSDPAAQDALTDEVIDHDLLGPGGANLKPMGVAVPVPEEYFERMAVFVPRSVLRVWRRFGFEGFGDGLFWITNPFQWMTVVKMWLDLVWDQLPFADTWFCVARSAMGDLFLWGEDSGRSLTINPAYGEVIIDWPAILSSSDPDPAARQRDGRAVFTSAAEWSVTEPADDLERPLAPQALKRLGPVNSGQMYGFVVPPTLGGPLSVENLHIVDAITYLTARVWQGGIRVDDPMSDYDNS